MKTTRLKRLMRGADLDTAPMQHRGKRSADLRIGTNRRFPANLAESEFGAPGVVSKCVLPVLVALSFVVVFVLHAQSYSINWFKVAGGGGTSTGGTYQVSGIPHCGTSTTPAGR